MPNNKIVLFLFPVWMAVELFNAHTVSDFCAISSTYLCGMWKITFLLKTLKAGRYFVTTLLTSTAHCHTRFVCTSESGRKSINWRSEMDFCGFMELQDEFATLSRTAYWWVQWRERLTWSLVCIRALIVKSILSATILCWVMQKYYYYYYFLSVEGRVDHKGKKIICSDQVVSLWRDISLKIQFCNRADGDI